MIVVADETTQRTDLADLTRSRMGQLGLSYRTLSAACVDPRHPDRGSLWTRGTLANLAEGLVIKAPKASQLRALAAGLRLPERAVKDAAAGQFFDMDIVRDEDADTRMMVHHYEELGPEDRERLRAIAADWSRRGGRRSSDAE